jgi:hypothetical protein
MGAACGSSSPPFAPFAHVGQKDSAASLKWRVVRGKTGGNANFLGKNAIRGRGASLRRLKIVPPATALPLFATAVGNGSLHPHGTAAKQLFEVSQQPR